MLSTEAVIDLSAIEANVAVLMAATFAEQTRAQVMAVVKADGYGHGLIRSARAALAGGASWLGTGTIDDALALRAAGITDPVFVSRWTPKDPDALARAVAAGIDLSVAGQPQLDAARAVAADLGTMARVHLGVDSGAGRGGCQVADWPDLLDAAAKAQANAEVEVVGVWSSFGRADQPDDPANDSQLNAFHQALQVTTLHGIVPQVRHIADSAAALTMPGTHFDLVRAGTAVYGLSPVPGRGDFGLLPAMTLRAPVLLTERHDGSALAVIGLGSADGIPGGAAGAPVLIDGRRLAVAGPVSLDQFTVDLTGLTAAEGDLAVLFGSGRDGEPLAQDWADAAGIRAAEIVAAIGPRVTRRYTGGTA